ncbi:GGDEF domain-containing protein [Roseobacter denitrificans]|uniref:EAL domain protein n=1 Tax=Roseobacter denitrificans (strain ATCC 33942 / OCh 114) TaxID=375451 RepID=Q16AA0_ROSDO|nr:GGDEF domain-containing phosphodiesterase [Roseobacter denitrificans]ABG31093.1 EAL domain protein [Roseobacter denitrificans OCh 114]AVL54166.1 GGDEF domain-containing protein [Roseobacter denitrificans]SFG33019.1 diguanylate cyclase/phosphodiesterase [Roseobacter denitrificans OCh 114]
MFKVLAEAFASARLRLGAILFSPQSLAFLPAFCLGLYWYGGETALMITALVFPVFFLVARAKLAETVTTSRQDSVLGVMQPDGFQDIVAARFREARAGGLISTVFQIEIDDHTSLVERHGQRAAEVISTTSADRIAAVLRDRDAVTHLDTFKYAVCLEPVRQMDLELCIQLAGRIQAALEEPIALDATAVCITSSVGFCQQTKVLSRSGEAWLAAAGHALREAHLNGPGAIRAYSEKMQQKSEIRAELREEVAQALEKGQIKPWFQPQISTDTGLVTGFEALARWNHPKRGMVPPGAFLTAIEQAGMLEKLAEVMIFHAFTALKAWDSAGVCVPQVGVNFAGPELSNPKLVDKIIWELDRFDLAPERLAVEVLETVVANSPDDTITRNINGLSKLGCRIDLDDFGTGHASISSIRRFSVSRIKIDRSFVIKADRDPEQQRMISAILTMAERLEVETLAEGVESVGEHALLAQLGCDHVQGFGIGKPMPFDQTLDWIASHNAKLQATPQILPNKLR